MIIVAILRLLVMMMPVRTTTTNRPIKPRDNHILQLISLVRKELSSCNRTLPPSRDDKSTERSPNGNLCSGADSTDYNKHVVNAAPVRHQPRSWRQWHSRHAWVRDVRSCYIPQPADHSQGQLLATQPDANILQTPAYKGKRLVKSPKVTHHVKAPRNWGQDLPRYDIQVCHYSL